MKPRTKRKARSAKTSTPKRKPAPTPAALKAIPGWQQLDALKLPTIPSTRHRVESRVAVEALLAMLWLDVSTRAVAKKPGAAPIGSLSRLLWHWARTPAAEMELSSRGGASVMHAVWRGYLRLLSPSEVEEWQRKLHGMAMSWRVTEKVKETEKDKRKVARWASRVHSFWFHEVFAATNRACGTPPLKLY